MRPKIFIGIHEICDTTLQFAKGFRELGYEVSNVVVDTGQNFKYPYTRGGPTHDRYIPHHGSSFDTRDGHIDIDYLNVARYGIGVLIEFLRHLFTHDVFIFNFSESFFGALAHVERLRWLSTIDLRILRLFDKKIVFIVNGSDLRSDKLLLNAMRANDHVSRDHVKALEMYLENTGGKVDENLNAFRRNVVQKYGDCVLAGGGGAVGLVEFEPFRPPVDPSELEYEISNATKPLVVHAPSDAQIKGTKFVIKSIEELRNEGLNFEFSLIQDRPAAEVREILSKSDIAVDQVIYPGHGLFAVEAMATGNAVLSGMIPGQFGFPENNPILSSTPANLTENLRILIEDKKLRRELQQRGLQYAKREHNYIVQCKLIQNKLETNI